MHWGCRSYKTPTTWRKKTGVDKSQSREQSRHSFTQGSYGRRERVPTKQAGFEADPRRRTSGRSGAEPHCRASTNSKERDFGCSSVAQRGAPAGAHSTTVATSRATSSWTRGECVHSSHSDEWSHCASTSVLEGLYHWLEVCIPSYPTRTCHFRI